MLATPLLSTEGSMSGTITWARLWPAAKLPYRRLRQGAWYPVTGTHLDGRLILAVGRRRMALPEPFFEVSDRAPVRFTIVWRRPTDPNPAKGTPVNLGCAYAVCPGCAGRVRLFGRQTRLRCPSCGHFGAADWNAIH